jgi:hypothetical protein
VRAILLPNGNLLVPVPPSDLDEPEGPALQEIGPEHPDYGRWLARAEPGEDQWPRGGGRRVVTRFTLERPGVAASGSAIPFSSSGREFFF